ncbi:hypothetical protein [Methylibium petroleiphilum]|uniref:Uncharacterized protein n=1 Tax=Methylibium petroleiphilum (strain ATCC BAA-1232 / LMG 22953 / PM1) TaxID=420662 RepID=A2SN46_METPP|nr:hypothetical protein [Methylibium petroleiphilum]ABM96985.1 hypothetical protein Mpe_B0210 [Methylibium petroleiphilum PM1]
MKRLDHLLWVLSEEGGEVGHRASKAARFGLDEIQPGHQLTNAQRLLGEWFDAIAAIEMLVEDGHLTMPPEEEIRAAVAAKKAQVERFLLYSAQVGRLDQAEEGCAC